MQAIIDTKNEAKSVSLKNTTKIFRSRSGTEETVAVDNISLKFEKGKLTTILGPSGCGKTTTLRMISGFEIPTHGDVFLGDKLVTNLAPNKRNIGMVFQNYALFPHLSIYENIAYGLKVQKLSQSEIDERVSKVLDMMQLSGMENRFPNQVSGGQQQRVALARAIVVEPDVLLFDEPLSNLDAKLREYMRVQLRNLQQRLGITSIYVTHDQAEAMAISDKVVILNKGRIEQVGTPYEIYQNPVSKFVASFMGRANFINVQVVDVREKATIVKTMDHTLKVVNPGFTKFNRGDTATAVIRPESVDITDDNNDIPGLIKNTTFYGSLVQYIIEALGVELIIEINNPQEAGVKSPGQEVFLHFSEDSIRLLRRET